MTDRKPLWEVMRDAFLSVNHLSGGFCGGCKGFAAEIRAIADQLVPDQPHPWHPSPELFSSDFDIGRWIEQQHLRKILLAEADRAEAGQSDCSIYQLANLTDDDYR